ncbi:MAG: enoyl-ACP reductase [Phycisphaeraceae bacterium]|nr:enoyl-ACP reductase [Phycisphaeraceae bacterium]
MSILSGKRGLVFGIANDRSYATFITEALVAGGAECLFTHLPDEKGRMENRLRSAVRELGIEDPWLKPCDVSRDEDLDTVFEAVKRDFGRIDFVIHSLAFANRDFLKIGNFHTTSRKAWTEALEISAYSLVAIAGRAAPLMPDGGSILAMSYYGGEKVCPGYNIMGIAKAALEHSARYLAWELGEKKIRVNTISGGPLRTLAASAVGGISEMFEIQARKSALRRNIEGGEVGQTAAFLVSDMSTAITGENIHVDAGFSIVGM